MERGLWRGYLTGCVALNGHLDEILLYEKLQVKGVLTLSLRAEEFGEYSIWYQSLTLDNGQVPVG